MGRARIAKPPNPQIHKFSKSVYIILGLAAAVFVVQSDEEDLGGRIQAAVKHSGCCHSRRRLPAVVTITLAIGVSRMARRHAIIRKYQL